MKGERVKSARDKKKLSQAQLGDLLNVTGNTVYRWEKNMVEPSDDTKKALASVLGVSVGYLMGEDEPRTADAPTSHVDEQPTKADAAPTKTNAAPVQPSYGSDLVQKIWGLKKEVQNADLNLREANSIRDGLNEVLGIVEKKAQTLSATLSSPNTQSCAEPLSVSA